MFVNNYLIKEDDLERKIKVVFDFCFLFNTYLCVTLPSRLALNLCSMSLGKLRPQSMV